MYIGPAFFSEINGYLMLISFAFIPVHCEKKPKKSLAERRGFNYPMRFIVAGNDHKRHLEILLILIIMSKVLDVFAALLKGQTVVRKVNQREAAAAVA